MKPSLDITVSFYKSYSWLHWLEWSCVSTEVSPWSTDIFTTLYKSSVFFAQFFLETSRLTDSLPQVWNRTMTIQAVWRNKRSSSTPTSSSWCSPPTGWMLSPPPAGANGRLTPITASGNIDLFHLMLYSLLTLYNKISSCTWTICLGRSAQLICCNKKNGHDYWLTLRGGLYCREVHQPRQHGKRNIEMWAVTSQTDGREDKHMGTGYRKWAC